MTALPRREIDTPGHSESWHVGYPEATVYSVNEYMLDPTKNATFEILDALFSELAEMFDGESTCARLSTFC